MSQTRKEFSDRLNQLLTEAGFSPLGAGRASELAAMAGVSRIAARKWLVNGSIPKDCVLDEICEQLLPNTAPGVTRKALQDWLIHGHKHIQHALIPLQSTPQSEWDHLLAVEIYATTAELAHKLGIDLKAVDRGTLQYYFDNTISLAHQNKKADREHIYHQLSLMKHFKSKPQS